MRRRLTAGFVAAVAAVAMAVPATGLANAGGTPHSTRACPTSSKGKQLGESKTHKGKDNGKLKGKKCG